MITALIYPSFFEIFTLRLSFTRVKRTKLQENKKSTKKNVFLFTFENGNKQQIITKPFLCVWLRIAKNQNFRRKFSKKFVGYFLTWLSLFSWSYDQRFWSFDSQRPAFDVTQKGRGPFLHSMNGPFGWGDAILLSGKHCLLFFD